jgi:hypothetical protein
MSMANLGASMGSKLFGSVAEYTSFAQNYALMGALLVAMVCVTAIFRKHDNFVLATEQEPAGG